MRLLSDGEAHELVPGGVEFDLVDPVAEPVMRPKLRGMPVRLPGEELDMGAADRAAGLGKLRLRPVDAEGTHDPIATSGRCA